MKLPSRGEKVENLFPQPSMWRCTPIFNPKQAAFSHSYVNVGLIQTNWQYCSGPQLSQTCSKYPYDTQLGTDAIPIKPCEAES